MMAKAAQQPEFRCPDCGGPLGRVNNTDGLYECKRCERRTHEKIESNREMLEALAGSDNSASRIAALLVGDS
jgi:transcription initiation factor IIE alpha subunit